MNARIIRWGFYSGLATAAIIAIEAFFLEKWFFEIKHFDIGKKNGYSSLKLVLLTDLHFQRKLWPFYKRMAKKVNELKPDLLMFTGDTLDVSGTLLPLKKFLHLLDDEILKVAIAGNHDHASRVDVTDLKAAFEKHNCNFLINETKVFKIRGTDFAVTGLDDFISGHADTAKAVMNVSHHQHHILLVHSPMQQEKAMEKIALLNEGRSPKDKISIKYIFAGHSHGGQIRLFNFVPILPQKSGNYVEGWYKDEPPYLYVSRGFGTSGVPFRFMARSEVTVFNYYF